MRTTHTTRRAVVATVLAGAMIVTVPLAADATPRRPSATNPHTTCEQVDLRFVTVDVATRLQHLGWTGRAGDGAERLYSDACPNPLRAIPNNAAG